MLCVNGKQIKPKGESAYYFICQLPDNKNNNCRFSRWCNLENKFEMTTDSNGNSCKFFSLKKQEEIQQKEEIREIELKNSEITNVENNNPIETNILESEEVLDFSQTFSRKNKKSK